jgi:hypothetical protein
VAELTRQEDRYEIVIEIGETPVRLCTTDADFLAMLENRYEGFVSCCEGPAEFEFAIELAEPGSGDADDDVSVTWQGGQWSIRRGDFQAELNPESRCGTVRQTANPYSIDAVLRILHSLLLAKEGGFLVHAASAVRNGKAYLFAGASGAGKTTIARLAPPDATLLTDEISYIRKRETGYATFGTPFTGELAKLGENISAPLAAVYVLEKGSENHIEAISVAEAGRALLSNVLFFADDAHLVHSVFRSACEFVGKVEVARLTFLPDASVWEMLS